MKGGGVGEGERHNGGAWDLDEAVWWGERAALVWWLRWLGEGAWCKSGCYGW